MHMGIRRLLDTFLKPWPVTHRPHYGEKAMSQKQAMIAGMTKRLHGVVSENFRQARIAFVGLGASSYAAEKCARLCPAKTNFLDMDTVQLPNLSRTAYRFADAANERLKVHALQERINEINPLVECGAYALDITSAEPKDLEECLDVDLIVAGTDQLAAQATINRWAVKKGIPAVFVGLHAGARGGRVIWFVPGMTPCYRCVARERFHAAYEREDVDLAAADGCLIDAQLVDMVALKIAVAILERGQESAMGRFFTQMGQRNEVMIRCDPDYRWGNQLWQAILSDLPREPRNYAAELQNTMLAMDSLWFPTQYDPDCPVCGGGRRRL